DPSGILRVPLKFGSRDRSGPRDPWQPLLSSHVSAGRSLFVNSRRWSTVSDLTAIAAPRDRHIPNSRSDGRITPLGGDKGNGSGPWRFRLRTRRALGGQ